MRPIERNSPCPCGSGHKSSRCCSPVPGTDLPSEQSWQWDDTPAMDAYCIVDREILAARLELQPDVFGKGDLWARAEKTPTGSCALAILTATPDGLLIVRTESSAMADRIYRWLARVSGDALLAEEGGLLRVGSVGEAS